MFKYLVLSITLLLAFAPGAHAAKDFPKLRKILLTKLEEIQVYDIFQFYSRNIPGLLDRFEKELPENVDLKAIEEGRVPENLEELAHHIKEAVEFFKEYQEMKREEPKEAERLLKIRKIEVNSRLIGDRIVELREDGEEKNAAEIEKLTKDLKAELGKLFELKLAAQKQELKWMEKELVELRQLIKKREKYRDKIIEKKLLELTGEEEVMEL